MRHCRDEQGMSNVEVSSQSKKKRKFAREERLSD